jgi:hypothetical protein
MYLCIYEIEVAKLSYGEVSVPPIVIICIDIKQFHTLPPNITKREYHRDPIIAMEDIPVNPQIKIAG